MYSTFVIQRRKDLWGADALEFRPERWLDPESGANQNPRNYLVFGSGPHKCIGLEYAIMNIEVCLALASTAMNWEHIITDKSEEVKIIATLFPQDDCIMRFTPRA